MTVLITGATDGVGQQTAKLIAHRGKNLLIHGRNKAKLAQTVSELKQINSDISVGSYCADLSDIEQIEALADAVSRDHDRLDVLINNAGIYLTAPMLKQRETDMTFMVNSIAPYVLTRRLLPILTSNSRVVNLASAAQSPVNIEALRGEKTLGGGDAYAQSKLAIIMWSYHLAQELELYGPSVFAVNPGSFLASKMVKKAYGIAGKDLNIGAKALMSAALDGEFAAASGRYFDNDSGEFAEPHSDVFNTVKNRNLVRVMDRMFAGSLVAPVSG